MRTAPTKYVCNVLPDSTRIWLNLMNDELQDYIHNPNVINKQVCTKHQFNILKRKGFGHEIGKIVMKRLIELSKLSVFQRKEIEIVLIDHVGDLLAKALWQHLKTQTHIYIYKGGMKNMLRFAENTIAKPRSFVRLVGGTGSGKTELLELLAKMNFQTLNLEALANHNGSVFGNLMSKTQPNQKGFTINIAIAIHACSENKPIFLEQESINLGTLHLPLAMFHHINGSPCIILRVSKPIRIARLVEEYAGINDQKLIEGIKFLQDKIGANRAEKLILFVKVKAYHKVAEHLLEYFDDTPAYRMPKTYRNEIIADDLNVAADKIRQIMP